MRYTPVLLLALASCLGAPAASLTPDELAARLATSYCRLGALCCQANAESPAAGCEASVREAVTAGIAQQMSKGQTYDAAAAGRCATAFDGLPNDCSRAAESPPSYDCRVVVDGTLAPGTACTDVAKCAQASAAALGGSVLCVENGAGNPTICKALVPAYRSGAACAQSTSDAGTTIYQCDAASSLMCMGGQCVASDEIGLGNDCSGGTCQTNLVCGADERCHLAHPTLSLCLGGWCYGAPTCN